MTRRLPSESEIAVLEALAAQGETLGATAAGGAAAFRARLLVVDPNRQFLILGRGGNLAAEAALLALPRAEFVAEWGEWRIGFAGEHPQTVAHGSVEAIRVLFPEVVSINRRRMLDRAAVPGHASLNCRAYSGTAVILDAIVTDVSQGGIGMLFDSGYGALEPGRILAKCLIERAGRPSVVVDLEVRHTATTTLPDGRQVVRAGCRFVDLPPEAMGLIAEYFRAKSPED